MDESTETVIVSPSMSTGVNFEGDRARFQILLKVPYPFLGSEKNKLRQKLRPDWYTWCSVGSLIQAYGRGVRSYEDTCDFIILDGIYQRVINGKEIWCKKENGIWFIGHTNKTNAEKEIRHSIHQCSF
jgi:Rad3-related DNA helicase